MRSVNEVKRDVPARAGRYREVRPNLRVKDVSVEGRRYVVCLNPEEAEKDRADLLRFFLNHHRFMRSDRDERVGKSPAELLSGEAQPHWLELLGFETFHRN